MKKNYPSWSRRKFLQSATAGSVAAMAAPLTSACTSIGRIIEGDSSTLTDRVVIIGGGVSGLVAARELKKNGVPFRLFEGSGRIGGRCLSLEDFNQASQTADLGAEWILEEHEFVKNLCRELRIELVSVPEHWRTFGFYQGGRVLEGAPLVTFLSFLERKLEELRDKLNDQQWDSLSAEEMIAELKSISDEKAQLWVRRLIQHEWGCDPHQISALMYFDRFRNSLSGMKKFSQSRMKIRGGTEILTKALHDRIAGVIPAQFIALNHQLTEVDQSSDEIELTFATPHGDLPVRTKVVIFALPFSNLRGVQGLDQIGLSELKVRAIQELGYGQHGKYVASYQDRFWSKKHLLMTGDIESQWVWESSVVRGGPLQASRGLLSVLMGGHSGLEVGPQSLNSLKIDFQKYSIKSAAEEEFIAKSWANDPWSKGSVSFFKPGQYFLFSNAVSSTEKNGKIIFAGEHTSSGSMGSLNGAVESGIRASMEALRMRGELTKRFI